MSAARPASDVDPVASIEAGVEAIRSHSAVLPEVAIVPGAGTGASLVAELDIEAAVPVERVARQGEGGSRAREAREVPDSREAGPAEAAPDAWLFGTLEGVRVVIVQGRTYPYEGHTLESVTWPIRVLGRLGVRALVLTESVGGLDPLWAAGDVARIDDHLNLLGDNPLVGPNLEAFGPRFPDMSQAYDVELGARADAVALDQKIPLRRGVFAALAGPSLETRAEYRMLRLLGADMVGLGLVPDVIVARHMGLRVLALAGISAVRTADTRYADDGRMIPAGPASEISAAIETRLGALIRGVLRDLGHGAGG